MIRHSFAAAASVTALALFAPVAQAQSQDERIEALEKRIEQLEETNRKLMEFLEAQGAMQPDAQGQGHAMEHADSEQAHGMKRTPHDAEHKGRMAERHHEVETVKTAQRGPGRGGDFVGFSSDYSYRVLDHAEGVNTRQLTTLKAIQSGELNDRVTFGGAITVLANYQESNSDTKFGWLMRHPTSANQIGETVSELVVHSAQLQTTAKVSEDLTAYIELLYNPEQSFGSGTITDLNRNQLEVRKAYVIWGNLDKRPVYASIGKMDTPFGLQDTVSPFTNSTSWHAFAGLAYGGMVGYYNEGLHIRAMAIQGGAQFRAHNSPVEDTSVPSRVNNFAIDANYTAPLEQGDWMLGASYTDASAYCQAYPVFHFNPCDENNPAWAVYSRLNWGKLEVLGEYAATTKEWPGSAVPIPTNPLSVFEAEKTLAFTAGARYGFDIGQPSDLIGSFEFSRFKAGEDGAPWERQDQWVAGLSYFLTPSVNLFGELVHTKGWVPLNFLSGGNYRMVRLGPSVTPKAMSLRLAFRPLSRL